MARLNRPALIEIVTVTLFAAGVTNDNAAVEKQAPSPTPLSPPPSPDELLANKRDTDRYHELLKWLWPLACPMCRARMAILIVERECQRPAVLEANMCNRGCEGRVREAWATRPRARRAGPPDGGQKALS